MSFYITPEQAAAIERSKAPPKEIPLRILELSEAVGVLETNLNSLRESLAAVSSPIAADPAAAKRESDLYVPGATTTTGQAIENQIQRLNRLNTEVLALRDAVQL